MLVYILNYKKKILFLVISLFISLKVNGQYYIKDILEASLKNNSQILIAQAEFETATLLVKNSGGIFAPNLVLSGAVKSKNDYSTSVTYTQPIPGGASFQMVGTYDYSKTEMFGTKVEIKEPNISFLYNQSLFPFWVAGQLEDVDSLSYKLQAEYYYYQLLYTKQTIITELLQNCVGAVSENNKIRMLNNSIEIVLLQEKGLEELKSLGGANESRILELEDSRCSFEQELLIAYSNMSSYIQKIKSICGEESIIINEKYLFELIPDNYTLEDFIIFFQEEGEYYKDPYYNSLELKIKLAENDIVNLKQTGAPVLSLSAAVPIDIEKREPGDWTFGISVDFSHLFSAVSAYNERRAKIELQKSKNAFSSYLIQKEFLKEQYENIITSYGQQLEKLSVLISKYEVQLQEFIQQLKKGAITQFDFENEKLRLENYKLTYENLRLSKWLYEIMRWFVL